MDIRLDEFGKLDLTNGNITMISGNAAVIQRVKIRLKTFLGEYFYDLSAGIPYRQLILVKSPDLRAIQNVFRASIGDTPGIDRVDSITLDYNPIARTLGVQFVAIFESTTEDESTCEEVFLTLDLEPYVTP